MILIGPSGAGKSVVAPKVAAMLGAVSHDLDRDIEALAGKTPKQIFAQQGEPAFRALERQAMDTVLRAPPGVIATGGGWAAEPGNLDEVRHAAFIVYLAVSPTRAMARLDSATDRPMLDGADRRARWNDLFRRRERWYRKADLTIDTDALTPDRVAGAVARAARARAGWESASLPQA